MENLHHVHEVLEMLAFSNQSFSKDKLEMEIETTFGHDACFANCADQNFNAKEVIEFIIMKGKAVEESGIIKLVSAPCSH